MRNEIHPTWYPQATVTCQCGNTWQTGATVEEIRTEICYNCHPFFTGEQRIVDTEGRVDKFMKRLQRRDNIREEVQAARQAASEVPVDLHISELDLNSRFENILVEAGITSVGDVLAVLEKEGDEGILNLSGIGQQALLDIKKGLRRHGHDVKLTEA